MSRNALAIVALLLFTSRVAVADVDSGPMVDKAIPPLPVKIATGDMSGESRNIAEHRGARPTVYVLVEGERFDRPAGRFLVELDKTIGQIGADWHVVAVWLGEQPDAAIERMQRIQMSLKLPNTTFVAHDGRFPNDWSIHDRASLTAVVVVNQTTRARFGYDSVNETCVPEVVKAVRAQAD